MPNSAESIELNFINQYSRSAPSPRYLELLEMYNTMHTEGAVSQNIPASQTFAGQSLPDQAENIKQFISQFSSKTLLDYGSGKGAQYGAITVTLPDGTSFPNIQSYWGVEEVTCYDPGYAPFSEWPEGRQFDVVISTDVLEHCPEEDIHWILTDMFSSAKFGVFANIASWPAKKTLPNGENAHCTIKPAAWWAERIQLIARQYANVIFLFLVEDAKGNVELIKG